MTPQQYRGRGKRIELPWPAKELSPNARGHWGKKASATKRARSHAWEAGLEAGLHLLGASSAELTTTFFPPTRGRYDDDNLIARCKSYYDGIADAMRVDDSRFRHNRPERGEVRKGGAVIVDIEVAADG